MDNVLVTGASRGIGLAIAARLAAVGYNVVAVARRASDPLDAAIAESLGKPGSLRFAPLDLSDIDAIPEFVRNIRRETGPIYGLVNNAGIGAGGLLGNMSNAQIEAVLRLNTFSPIVLTKYVARGMMAEGRGRIVNMSSIVASTGFNALSVYGASKASMVGFTKSLAREVGRLGITVNAIAPGFIDTEMTAELDESQRKRVVDRSALRRMAEVSDIAAMVEFLLGETGRNITGSVLTIDAGATA
jgi:3-oxoacyl-[acyl-carrier protein] reductase